MINGWWYHPRHVPVHGRKKPLHLHLVADGLLYLPKNVLKVIFFFLFFSINNAFQENIWVMNSQKDIAEKMSRESHLVKLENYSSIDIYINLADCKRK